MKDGAAADKNKWKDRDLLSEWYINIINFCWKKKKKVWMHALAALFLWCKRLSPVTPARNVSPQPIYFKCRTGKFIKILHKSKKFRGLCCHLSQRWISLKQMMSTSFSARVTQLTDKMYSWNNYDSESVFALYSIHFPSQKVGAVASCYLDDSSNKLSFSFLLMCSVLSSFRESPLLRSRFRLS